MRAYIQPVLLLSALTPATMATAQQAETSPVVIVSAEASSSIMQAASAGQARSPFAVSAINESDLGAIAGREDTTQIAQNEQFAGVANNSVGNNVVTGDARISDNAFQNMSGLSILNVNTGNNVAINASMNVNVSISPAP